VFHGWGFRAISGITLIESVGSMSVSATSPLMAAYRQSAPSDCGALVRRREIKRVGLETK
jgi:hypothetical protein